MLIKSETYYLTTNLSIFIYNKYFLPTSYDKIPDLLHEISISYYIPFNIVTKIQSINTQLNYYRKKTKGDVSE